jgi:hypothetical protein
MNRENLAEIDVIDIKRLISFLGGWGLLKKKGIKNEAKFL